MNPWPQQTGEGFQALLTLRPELQKKYRAFLSAVENNDAVPDKVLALCRARIQQIHGQEPQGIDPETGQALAAGRLNDFSGEERVALVAAERMPYQHHELPDEEVEAVKAAFGNKGCVALLTALAFFDVTSRLEAAFQMGSD